MTPRMRQSPWRTLVSLLAAAVVIESAACGGTGAGNPAQPSPGPSAWQESARLETVRKELHSEGSGADARALFRDLTLTYVDDGRGIQGTLNPSILPYRYYWSPSGHVTIAICNVDRTLFVCPFRLDRLLTTPEFQTCDVHPFYSAPELVPTPPVGRP